MRYRPEREHDIEHFAQEEAKRRGGIALKWVCPARIGAPDRIVILPGPRIGFLELKSERGKPRAGQLRFHKMLREQGCLCEYAYSNAEVIRFMNKLARTKPQRLDPQDLDALLQ